MAPPLVNAPFRDPDFGSPMVRATDETTNFKIPGSYLRNEASGQGNIWSSDTSKFYVIGQGGYEFAFHFNPSTMKISSLPGASPGKGLVLPLRTGSSFSFTDPDLIYGTRPNAPLTITSYRFSTAVSTPVIDTSTCGTQPSLVPGPNVVGDDDVSLSKDDNRLAISEGGPQQGQHIFVTVYDKKLGCRWYNTQTGQIGGQWGASGSATVSTSYLIRHAYLSRSGNYVRILTNGSSWYVWDVATLVVTACSFNNTAMECGGYGVVGYNSYVNALGIVDQMNIGKRSLANLAQITPLVPLVPPFNFGQAKHFTWSNVDQNDSTPVCASSYNYEGDTAITQPFDGEIFCIETDGAASTVWRFAHNRAIWVNPIFNTQPLGNISMDGRFFLFTSGWDGQLGNQKDGTPRSDVWIVKLD
jgi:hypothetical protein